MSNIIRIPHNRKQRIRKGSGVKVPWLVIPIYGTTAYEADIAAKDRAQRTADSWVKQGAAVTIQHLTNRIHVMNNVGSKVRIVPTVFKPREV